MTNASKNASRLPESEYRKVKLEDGRIATVMPAEHVVYVDGLIESGFAQGVGADDFFLYVARQGAKPIYLFGRRDEMEAIITVLASALFVESIMHRKA
jgi:hypothetical protein